MANQVLNGILDGVVNHTIIIQKIESGETKLQLQEFELINGDGAIDIIKDFVPFFLEFIREKLSRFLAKKQISSCTPKRKQLTKANHSSKKKDKKSPASRVNLISKYNPVTSSPINSKNAPFPNSSFNSTFDSPIVSSFPQAHSRSRRQHKTTNSSFNKNSPQIPSKVKELPFQLSGADDFPCIGSTPVQKKKSVSVRRITPTLVDNDTTQSQQTTEPYFEQSPTLESSDSSRNSESPSFISPHDRKMAKLEKKMRKGKKNEAKKMPLSSFLTDRQESRQGLNDSKFGTLTPNLERKLESRLHLSPATPQGFDNPQGFDSPLRNSIQVEIQEKQNRAMSPDDVKEKAKIIMLVDLYHCILSENLASNVLLELYFMFGVLTCQEKGTAVNEEDIGELFYDIQSCVFFVSKVLEKQQRLLIHCDRATQKLIVENQRLNTFCPEFVKAISSILDKESDSKHSFQSSFLSPSTGVPFRADSDNRKAFPSDKHFYSFSKQRDKFYELVRNCEENRLSQDWSLKINIGDSFRQFFWQFEDHPTYLPFSKLFVSQLIEMCKHDTTSNLGNNESSSASFLAFLKKSDPEKYQRLQERFFTPSFSRGPCPQPYFTDIEKFFKTFVSMSNNYNFIRHLIDVLVTRISEIDVFEFPLETFIDKDTEHEDTLLCMKQDYCRCVAEARLLGKFLGYCIFSPYEVDTDLNSAELIQNQISQRKSVCQPFDPGGFLKRAVQSGRLIFTLPWLMEFCSMMDHGACKLEIYERTLKMLYEVYRMQQLRISSSDFNLNKFFILLQLGWLFELAAMPEHLLYHSFEDHMFQEMKDSKLTLDDIPLVDRSFLYNCCPYLNEIRVLLADANKGDRSKAGPFRKITPISAEEPSILVDTKKQLRLQLIENFLKYQPKHMKESVDFVVERLSNNVRTHLSSILLLEVVTVAVEELKKEAKTGESETKEFDTLKDLNKTLFIKKIKQAQDNGKSRCQSYVEKYCDERVNGAVSSLLPIESNPKVVDTAGKIVKHRILEKISEWISHQLPGILHKEMSTAHNKILMNIIKEQNKKSPEKIDNRV